MDRDEFRERLEEGYKELMFEHMKRERIRLRIRTEIRFYKYPDCPDIPDGSFGVELTQGELESEDWEQLLQNKLDSLAHAARHWITKEFTGGGS